MNLLKGKVAIITGASRGIGRGIALKFAQNGADVVFTFHSSEEKAKFLEEELKSFGMRVKSVKSDAANYSAAEELIKNVSEEFGRIDVVVNNAGITRDGLLMRMGEQNWDEVINANLKSVFNMTKAVQRIMLKQRSGSVINISSVVGVRGNAGQTNYAASKAGIIGFSKSVAKELGSRTIRCNVIAPGYIVTEMSEQMDDKAKEKWYSQIPMQRLGTVEEVANLALFLASDLSSYITGQVICVDGGMGV